MMKGFWALCLKLAGWKTEITATLPDKCVICVAPHTSTWDFILGLLSYYSIGRKANFLMKEAWFFFPLKYLFKAMGGIPVPERRTGASLTEAIVERFKTASYLNLAVTPEGTRSRTSRWKTGFLYIAHEANVPVLLGVIDYEHKTVRIADTFTTTGDVEADMAAVRKYYSR